MKSSRLCINTEGGYNAQVNTKINRKDEFCPPPGCLQCKLTRPHSSYPASCILAIMLWANWFLIEPFFLNIESLLYLQDNFVSVCTQSLYSLKIYWLTCWRIMIWFHRIRVACTLPYVLPYGMQYWQSLYGCHIYDCGESNLGKA